jgi:hypothetical protein
MRKKILALLAGAVFVASLSGAMVAQATPSKGKCSACHTSTTAMTITIKKTATNTYKATVSGAKGIGVFRGVTKVKGVYGKSVTFKTKKGSKYTVYGVNGYKKGYKAKSFYAK